jgi:hypothetical protein
VSIDFSGKWSARLESNAFLPGIEAGMVSVRIDHVEPLLQLTVVAAAPRYALGHFVCNYRTDRTELVTSTHGIRVRTNAHWEGDELCVDTSIGMGSYSKHLQSRWCLSNDGSVLTMWRREGDFAPQITILHRQDLPRS